MSNLAKKNLVVVEHDNNEVGLPTLNAVTAAKQIGGDIDLLVAGENCGAVAEAAAKIAGVSTPVKTVARSPKRQPKSRAFPASRSPTMRNSGITWRKTWRR
jgi:electron transfer flavoprotein alpha subunit